MVVNHEALTDWGDFWEKTEGKLIDANSAGIDLRTPHSLLVHALDDVNEQLKLGRYFFKPTISGWASLIDEASLRFGVPVPWIERVMASESGGRIMLGGRPIRSRVGAIGLMQLMPATWQDMRAAYDLGPDPDDPHDNIFAGTAYLRLMYDRFGYPGLFAAYNAGPGRYATAIATGRRLPEETLAYLAVVTGLPGTLPAPQRQAAMQTLFVVRHEGLPPPTPDAATPVDPLFVARGTGPPGP